MENEDIIIRNNSFYDTDSELGIVHRTEEELIEYGYERIKEFILRW